VVAVLAPAGGAAAAPGQSPDRVSTVDVVKVDGLLDPVLTTFVAQTIDQANAEGAVAVVLQVDSAGAVVSDAELEELLVEIRTSGVPVDVWIGPSGSEATGLAAMLAGAASVVGMAPGTRLGLDGATPTPAQAATARRPVPTAPIGATEALDLGITARPAPTIGDFIVDLPGVQTREVAQGDQTRREPVTLVRFTQLSLLDQLFHTVASPAVAYLLFVLGMALLIFELFTAGVGVAGVVGAGSFVLACYGLGVLPLRWWAVGLLVASMAAFAVDVQTGVPRVWTGVGFVLFAAGSLTLYDGVSLSWVTLLFAFVAVLLAFLSGMPSMVRTRFSTPTIGREWMIGEMGRAVTAVDPDGVVQIKGALWRATTNRATPVDELDRVRVVGIEGLVLEVEPEEGGARDYRERGPRSTAGVDAGPDEDDTTGNR
jgi:membrane-bound serine protease (ClpP class)